MITAFLAATQGIEHLTFPETALDTPGWLQFLGNYQPVRSLVPIPLLLILAWPIWRVFRGTWRDLDDEATAYRVALKAKGGSDLRPAACLALVAAILTVQEYYGGRQFYDGVIRPELAALDAVKHKWVSLDRFDSLYSYGWWALSRILGYVIVPVLCWKVWFRKDSLMDMGLRTKGLLRHAWMYFGLLALVVPALVLVARQPDFGSYYPFYKQCSRSWFDLIAWETMYFAQFVALEFFFRGWMVGALRHSLGSGAVFVMAVPYCMIHYGKPYLEAHGAVVAGVVLGSLALRTRSIYSGALLHISVAALMDFLSLYKRAALPTTFWAK